MRSLRIFALAACLGGMVLSGCSAPTTVDAGSSGTGNARITATVSGPSGAPAAWATVRLRAADYLASPGPGKSRAAARRSADVLTDDSGRFVIDSIDTGDYRIEVSDGRSCAVLIDCVLGRAVRDVELGAYAMKPYGAIAGRIDTAGRSNRRLVVQVYGTEHRAAVEPSGAFALDSLAEGQYRLRLAAADSSIPPQIIDSVNAVAGDTTALLAGWRFGKRLTLNTTPAGANVAEDVPGFPLLVRLDSVAFGSAQAASLFFSQTRDSGQDLRFSKPDGRALPYEIEQWDAAAARAAIWVLLDTVRGNDTTQFILMHWGNPAAAAGSAAAALGLPLWQCQAGQSWNAWENVPNSENFPGALDGTAAGIYADLTVMNAEAVVFSYILESNAGQGLYDGSGPTCMVRAVRQFSTFVRPGAVRLHVQGLVSDPVAATAFLHPVSRQLSVVILNQTTDAVSIDLAWTTMNGVASFDQYRSSATDVVARLASIGAGGGKASLTLAARSIVTLVAQNVTRIPTVVHGTPYAARHIGAPAPPALRCTLRGQLLRSRAGGRNGTACIDRLAK